MLTIIILCSLTWRQSLTFVWPQKRHSCQFMKNSLSLRIKKCSNRIPYRLIQCLDRDNSWADNHLHEARFMDLHLNVANEWLKCVTKCQIITVRFCLTACESLLSEQLSMLTKFKIIFKTSFSITSNCSLNVMSRSISSRFLGSTPVPTLLSPWG